MKTITVSTQGARVRGHWFTEGTYTSQITVEFEGPAYYWLEPTADHHLERWLEEGIRLGKCNSPQQLDGAIDAAIRERGILDNPIWLLGATTEVSLFLEKHG